MGIQTWRVHGFFPETKFQAIPLYQSNRALSNWLLCLYSSLTTQVSWRTLYSQKVSSRINPAQLLIASGTDWLIPIPVSHFLSSVYSLEKNASGRENVYLVMTFLTRVSWVCFKVISFKMCGACVRCLLAPCNIPNRKVKKILEIALKCLHPLGHPIAEWEFKCKLLFLRASWIPLNFSL